MSVAVGAAKTLLGSVGVFSHEFAVQVVMDDGGFLVMRSETRVLVVVVVVVLVGIVWESLLAVPSRWCGAVLWWGSTGDSVVVSASIAAFRSKGHGTVDNRWQGCRGIGLVGRDSVGATTSVVVVEILVVVVVVVVDAARELDCLSRYHRFVAAENCVARVLSLFCLQTLLHMHTQNSLPLSAGATGLVSSFQCCLVGGAELGFRVCCLVVCGCCL